MISHNLTCSRCGNLGPAAVAPRLALGDENWLGCILFSVASPRLKETASEPTSELRGPNLLAPPGSHILCLARFSTEGHCSTVYLAMRRVRRPSVCTREKKTALNTEMLLTFGP